MTKGTCACPWSGCLWHCCPSAHPPKPQIEEPLGRYKPSLQRKPSFSWPDWGPGPRRGRVKTSDPVPQADLSAGGGRGGDRGRRAGDGVRGVWGKGLWGIQSWVGNTAGPPRHLLLRVPALVESPWSGWGLGWGMSAPESGHGSVQELWGLHSSLKNRNKGFRKYDLRVMSFTTTSETEQDRQGFTCELKLSL